MSPGKVHRYLASFLAVGLARQDPDTRKYVLGPLALQIGLAALNSYQPLRDATVLQQELRDRLDETMVLSVWGTHGPTIVHVAESSQPIIMTMRVGAVLPILATASGLAFAAFLPRHITKPFIRAALKADGGLNLFARDHASIDRLIAKVRESGYQHQLLVRAALSPDEGLVELHERPLLALAAVRSTAWPLRLIRVSPRANTVSC
jgi:DNA-binding IclR family transcriptional regulator